jgi:putative DNA primase/helicase
MSDAKELIGKEFGEVNEMGEDSETAIQDDKSNEIEEKRTEEQKAFYLAKNPRDVIQKQECDKANNIDSGLANNAKDDKKTDNEEGEIKTEDKVEKRTISEFIADTTIEIMNDYNLVTVKETGEILRYENGVYVIGGEILIQEKAEEICGYGLTNRMLNEIIGHIRRNTFHSMVEFDSDANIINMKNGLYDIRDGKLKPHSPTYLSRKQKPFSFNPLASPKYFGKFLGQVLYPNEIRTAVEAMAYTLCATNLFEVLFIFHGIGANGKSVLLGVITSLHGEENVSNVPLSSMINNRFALADLENKDLNVDTEMVGSSYAGIILKRLTGKHSIRIERKNQNAYDTTIHAKLIFSANTIPKSDDTSDGYYRRHVILSFPNQFIDGKEDPHMLEKLTTEDELAGIFNVLIPVLRRLLKSSGIFINQKNIAERRLQYERAMDSVQAFLSEAVNEEATESDIEIKQDLYHAYVKYCKIFALAIQPIETFGKIMKKGHVDGREYSGLRRTYWKGVKIKNEYRMKPIQLQLITEK